MEEIDILHNKIGQLLVSAGPADAQKIISRAKLSPEGDVCEYEYDYFDNEGNEDWFVPDKHASHDLRLLLVELRNFYIKNNLTNGKPAWSGCEITVDVSIAKIFFNFQYDD